MKAALIGLPGLPEPYATAMRLALTVAVETLTAAVDVLGQSRSSVTGATADPRRHAWATALLSVAENLDGMRRLCRDQRG